MKIKLKSHTFINKRSEYCRYQYKRIRTKDGLIDEHRLVMEQYLGRKLRPDEVVHHINGNKQDNRIENLEVMTNSEHTRFHKIGKTLSKETKKKISENRFNKANHNSKKVKQIDKNTKQTLAVLNSTIQASRYIHKKDGEAHIRDCCRGKRKTAYGYIWKWA